MLSRIRCMTLGIAASSTLIWVIPHQTLSTDESAIALWQKPSAIASSDVQPKRLNQADGFCIVGKPEVMVRSGLLA